MLPLVVAFSLLTLKVNTLIQISIVGQKALRQAALYYLYNHPEYPRRRNKEYIEDNQSNLFILGVSENSFYGTETEPPVAVTYNIARAGGPQGSNFSQEEPRYRNNIRVRTTLALCTMNNFVGSQGRSAPTFAMNTHSKFSLCRGHLE